MVGSATETGAPSDGRSTQPSSSSGKNTAAADDLSGPAEALERTTKRFPERVLGPYKQTVKDAITGIQPNLLRIKCEKNVQKVIETSYPVKLMMAALKSVGCPMDLNRHISCELCDTTVHGGFDTANKQIVVCENISVNQGKVTSVLVHEMIHAFDYCRANFDPKNVEHIACSEIRASALTHCSFLSAFFGGLVSPLNFKNRHQDCVKVRATESTRQMMNIPLEDALAAVEKVFPKCYADLEPFGRIPRRNSRDAERAYYDRIYYGYND